MAKIKGNDNTQDINITDEILLKKLGAFLKTMRKAAGFTSKRAFADTIEMSYSQYHGYESGKNITILTLKRILLEFNIKVENWLNLNIFNDDTDDSQLILNLRQARIDQLIEQVKSIENFNVSNNLGTKEVQRYIDILIYCNTPKSRSQILKRIKMDDTVNTFKRVAGKLITYGWLDYTDKVNKNNPNQKYCTTNSGKKVLQLKDRNSQE